MAEEYDQPIEADPAPGLRVRDAERRPRRRGRWRGVLLALAGLIALVLAIVWLLRKDIADNVIGSQLDSLGLSARYEIVSIGPSEQVVRHLVIGDPKRPDLTVEEVRVATRLFWGLPGIGRVTVVRPRLYGAVRGGRVSFGSLDKALFTGQGGPFRLPDLDLAVVDGRALIESEYGRIGARLQGEGHVRGGFSGELAAIAPELAVQGCKAARATLYGKITTASERPRFKGPVRIGDLNCVDPSLALARAGVQLDMTFDQKLDGADGKLGWRSGPGRYADNRIDGLLGTASFSYHKRSLNARYRVTGRGIAMPQARFAELTFDGRARSADGLGRFDVEGDLDGKGIALGSTLDRMLADAVRAGQGTLAAPLAARMRDALAQEARGSSLAVNLILRRGPEGVSLVVPHGALKGGSGASLLTLSRLQALFGGGAFPRVTGNFATGGRGLPQVSGRMESGRDGRLAMHLTMPEYSAGTARLELPQAALLQAPDGTLAFNGTLRMSGDLPGGRAENLFLPVDGIWAADGNLAIWRRCTQVAFDRVQFASLTLDRRDLLVCPAHDGAIVRGPLGAVQIVAGVSALDLSGRLGETPIHISSGPLGFAQHGGNPGTLRAKALKVDLGPAETASHFSITDLAARIGKDVAGTFEGADIGLYAVPLDLRRASGNWGYSAGALTIDRAAFTLIDRQQVGRFNPMVARDATLRLADNVITARALMREPKSDRDVVQVDIVHDLGTAAGHANLAVEDLRFDSGMQADTLSGLALGVVSNLEGEVHGTGRIDWNAKGVTSRGRFASAGLDFAAPFGPVKGLSGEVVLTDLLGLVTAPDQTLHIASINPGIEVTDGTISFEMRPDYLLRVNGGRWPFMSGVLTLEPVQMKIGVAETRHYTLKVNGLDAQTFVQHLELSNLNASGVFDGQLPLIFDENGGRIEDGYLVSRPPGGNVAYVGELTYKDLSAMGNFAFQTLKSVDYQRMEISLGGTLAGEIITRVSFNGISQGAGAKRNFLTKQIAKLPIRFVLNVKAPFFSLFAPLRSLYDPSYVTDPRTLGLIGTDGRARVGGTAAESPIQPPVSEKNP